MKSAVFAIVLDAMQAETVVDKLRLSGFLNNDISVLFPDVEETRELTHATVIGGSTVGIIGGLTGRMIGLGAVTIPGVGPLIAAGPIFAALSGLAMGLTAGGLSSALAGLGFSDYEAQLYAGKLENGNILIAAHTENHQEQNMACSIFERAYAHDFGISLETAVPC